MRAHSYSNDTQPPREDCLHWRDSLNSVAIPPPIWSVLAAPIKMTFGGADSVRVVALHA